MQTSVVQAHIVATVFGVRTPFHAAQWGEPEPLSGGPLPFPAIRFQPLFLPESRNKNRCATRVQGLSLGVFSPSPRLSALRAQTGAGQFGATAISSDPFNQEGKRKSEACLNQKLRGYYE